MHRRNSLLLVLAGLALSALVAGALAKPTLHPNPANAPKLISKKLDPNRYDGADGCVNREPRGMRRLIRWMKRNTKRNTAYGTIRCDGGVHGTGRALDWMLDARDRGEKRKAMRVINTWLARDRRDRRNALARRMGIQLIIYNCRWWQAGDRGWSPYSACDGRNPDPTQGHIDHIHIELTKPAARLRTSYWEYASGGGGGGGGGSGGGGIGARTASATAHPPLHPPQPPP
jgi:hypothetical protein